MFEGLFTGLRENCLSKNGFRLSELSESILGSNFVFKDANLYLFGPGLFILSMFLIGDLLIIVPLLYTDFFLGEGLS
jgi:hypothetical protein